MRRAASTRRSSVLRDEAEHRPVALNDLVHARPLDLDHHRVAAVQLRPVGLPDRRGRERLGFELVERLVDRLAELGLEHFSSSSGGTRSTSACRFESSSVIVAGSRSVRVEAIWPNFTNIPPERSSTIRSRRARSGESSAATDR